MRLALAVALAGSLVAAAPARADQPPCELNALDCLAVTQFSATADGTSDALFVTTLALPIGLELGRGLDDAAARRGLAYGASVGATALTAGLAKLGARRARPYTYNRHPAVVEFTRTASGNHFSFFSGHTSMAFAAATSGALLYSPTTESERARLGVWVGAGALASATGVLRIRAGQHFPTDVLVGAAVGTAFGIGLTYAIAPDVALRGRDLAALGAGVAVGTLAATFVPLPRDVRLPLGLRDLAIAPTASPTGAGLVLSGALR